MKETLDFLWKTEVNINGVDFRNIFGESMGQHLWDKFTGYNHSLLRLWRALDLENQRLFCKYLLLEKI